MPRFYFHLYNAVNIHDDVGKELPTLEAARAGATQACRAIMAEDVCTQGQITLSHRIDIAGMTATCSWFSRFARASKSGRKDHWVELGSKAETRLNVRPPEQRASWSVQSRVPHYFFDTRDGDTLIEDDEGLELPDLETVKTEAARSLAELARDVLPGSLKRTLVVEVRDDRQPVLEARLVFEAIVLVP